MLRHDDGTNQALALNWVRYLAQLERTSLGAPAARARRRRTSAADVLKVLAYDTEQQSTSEPVEHSTIEQSAQATDRHHLDRLSPLESRVLARLTQGASTDQIASELETSPNWVHLRIRSIRNRLEVNSTAEAVTLADRFAGERIVVAVQQLDDPQVAVRQGGLYALEQFAQNTPAQRQAVVNELCAYLRKPYQPPDGYPRPKTTDAPCTDADSRSRR